jgi:hypothetical protein
MANSFCAEKFPSSADCVGNVLGFASRRLLAERWNIASQLRGLEYSHFPPFFDHAHDASFTSSVTIFAELLLGRGAHQPTTPTTGDPAGESRGRRLAAPLLNITEKLMVLEIGSFEGSSAVW